MGEGVSLHGEDAWKKKDWREHFNHAIGHALALLAGDTSDDHMSHFACRALMAYETYLQQRRNEKGHDDGREKESKSV
jgi:hypothetical protein